MGEAMGAVSCTDGGAAGPGVAVLQASEQQQYLTFFVRRDMFALAILAVREIIEFTSVTPVPMAPPFIRGVINLRGAVVPVVDLGARFGLGQSEPGSRSCVVIVEGEAGDSTPLMGVLVDSVSEVLEISAQDVEPPPEFGTSIRLDFISGMGKVGGKFVTILDIGRILALGELTQQG